MKISANANEELTLSPSPFTRKSKIQTWSRNFKFSVRDRFSNFSGETVGDTGKKPMDFLVDLSEMNNFHHFLPISNFHPFLPILLQKI